MSDSSALVARLMVTELQDFVDRWYEVLIHEGLLVRDIREVVVDNLTDAITYARKTPQD
jgi:hypothetical protein